MLLCFYDPVVYLLSVCISSLSFNIYDFVCEVDLELGPAILFDDVMAVGYLNHWQL